MVTTEAKPKVEATLPWHYFLDENVKDLPGTDKEIERVKARWHENVSHFRQYAWKKIRRELASEFNIVVRDEEEPHWIEAKGRLHGGSNFLTWVGKDGNQMFAKKVFHPGTTGKHLVENAAKQYKPLLKERVITETNNFMKVNRL